MRTPFLPPEGIVSDDTTFATPGRWADGDGTRFWMGKPQSIGGWASAMLNTLSGVCRNVLAWQDNGAVENIAFGTHTSLEVLKNGTLSDITPASLPLGAVDGAGGPGYGSGGYGEGGYGEALIDTWFPRTWSLTNFGQLLMASPRAGPLYVWQNDPAAVATIVTQAPVNINFMVVTPERQVLACGCNEEVSGDFNPLCIRGSDLEDYTDWTTTPANNSFEHILEGGGRIVAASVFGSNIAVWTDHAAYLGQFIGNPDQTYRFDKIADNCGLIGPNAFKIIGQTAFWITPDAQFFAWTLRGVPVLLPCPIRNDFKDNLAQGQFEKICATSISQYGEVWWFYPDAREGVENSRYIAVRTVVSADQSLPWFKGQMARSACCDASPTQYPLFVDPDGGSFWHENGYTANGAPLSGFITSSDQYIDEAARNVMIRGIFPDFEEQEGAVSLTLSLRKYPQSTARTKGPYILTAGLGKKDFMCQGRVVSATFSWSSSPARVRFGKPDFDTVPTGQE